jgi:hypothetical protein
MQPLVNHNELRNGVDDLHFRTCQLARPGSSRYPAGRGWETQMFAAGLLFRSSITGVDMCAGLMVENCTYDSHTITTLNRLDVVDNRPAAALV